MDGGPSAALSSRILAQRGPPFFVENGGRAAAEAVLVSMSRVVRINLWSGPRNVSTAVMYSFRQRSDTRVVDEPLYAHYLRVSGAEHPGREEVLAAMDNDGERVVREVVLGPCDRPVLFMKQMAHHLIELDRGFLRETVNVNSLLVKETSMRPHF